jgi:uncharacterized protein (DUF433 family)
MVEHAERDVLLSRAYQALYAIRDAAVVIDRPESTLRRWALGNRRTYRSSTRFDEPLITVDGTADSLYPLSFLNLIELRFLDRYRDRVPLPAIRRALDFASRELGASRPLLEHRFQVHGRELFLRWAAADGRDLVVNATRAGPLAVWPEEVVEFLDTVDYDVAAGLAEAWWPLGRDWPLIVAPGINGGYPTTTEHGVRSDAIVARFLAGESEAAIQSDLDVSTREFEAALIVERVHA